jgi:hypothetical protein
MTIEFRVSGQPNDGPENGYCSIPEVRGAVRTTVGGQSIYVMHGWTRCGRDAEWAVDWPAPRATARDSRSLTGSVPPWAPIYTLVTAWAWEDKSDSQDKTERPLCLAATSPLPLQFADSVGLPHRGCGQQTINLRRQGNAASHQSLENTLAPARRRRYAGNVFPWVISHSQGTGVNLFQTGLTLTRRNYPTYLGGVPSSSVSRLIPFLTTGGFPSPPDFYTEFTNA